METNSSGEDLVIKTRKPYTITKQRERWTEEDHDRFLEALRLYGRAWQKIEEHVATKTAVQIRSHAQKFFSKVEKEAEAKGVPIDQALDIAIPPPRPKRKPSNPYPRKKGSGAIPMLKTGLKDGKEPLRSEKVSIPQIANEDRQHSKMEENLQEYNCSDCFTHEYISAESSMNKSSIETSNENTFREFLPSQKEQGIQNNGIREESNSENYCDFNAKSLVNNEQRPHTYPSHIPVLAPLGSSKTSPPSYPPSEPDKNEASKYSQLYTAAAFASSFSPLDSCGGQGNSSPNLAAMAAATVAAASAWWAANGLLPLSTPFNSYGFTCHPPLGSSGGGNDTKTNTLQHVSTAFETSKTQSSLESEEIENEPKPDYHEQPSATVETDAKVSDDAKDRKVDRSSCGSNTTSSSDDVEADGSNGEVKEVNADTNNPQTSESNAARRSRISSNLTDPWKSVSDEGRIAFQALFSREVLPQSFTYQKEFRYPMAIDLNCTAQLTPTEDDQEENRNLGFVGIGLSSSKLSKVRTGFKPYKRCSMEVKESKTIDLEQKDPKRVRLETEALT